MAQWRISSGVGVGLIVISLACLASFIFYRMGTGLGLGLANSLPVSTRLRGNKSQPRVGVDCDDPPREATFHNYTIPACAQDVFVTLHKEVDGEGRWIGGACAGLLVRDDIIVTSRACSASNFTLDFPGLGLVRAVPHAWLNSRIGMEGSRLGFLEAQTPFHRHFLESESRRMLMFLSRQAAPGNRTEGVRFISCADEGEPIGYNFPVDGDMIPLSSLSTVLTDHVLWKEDDIPSAPMLSFGSYRWWSKAITLSKEEKAVSRLIRKYQGPPGSVSVPEAHRHWSTMASALFETVDPRGHRYAICFNNYFERYRKEKPFSRLHFFDWLDFGPGRLLFENSTTIGELEYMEGDEDCDKHSFDRDRVHFFNDEERLEYEVYITPSEDGQDLIARYKESDEFVPESSLKSPHLYMWDLDGRFYVVDEDNWDSDLGKVKHTSILAGQPALSAGKAYFGKNGSIWGINYASGHYRPEVQAVAVMYQWVKDHRWNTTSLHWVGRETWSRESCEKAKWEDMAIPGFNNDDIKQSCFEVVASPTWILREDV